MTQATFGPSRAALAEYRATHGATAGANHGGSRAGGEGALAAAAWLARQMELPASLLRPYLRKRSSPRLPDAADSGRAFSPCEAGSRWHRYAFTWDDKYERIVATSEKAGVWTLRVDGQLRTEVTEWDGLTAPAQVNASFAKSWTICEISDMLYTGSGTLYDRRMRLSFTHLCTGNPPKTAWYIWEGNPPISFTSFDATSTHDFTTGAEFVQIPNVADVLVMERLVRPCRDGTATGGLVFMKHGGEYYKFDKRLKLGTSTLDNPADFTVSRPKGVDDKACPSTAQSFLNKGTCVVKKASCAAPTFTGQAVTLNDENIRRWYTLDGRHVHRIIGLGFKDNSAMDSPCKEKTSRWEKSDGACPSQTALDADTLQSLTVALRTSTDTSNPYVRDITKPTTTCDSSDAKTVGASITVDGVCWTHVYIDMYNVYDFTYWSMAHDGNDEAFKGRRPSPIRKFARLGNVNLLYPSHHAMSRWEGRRRYFPLLGRYGDAVPFSDLPLSAQTPNMASRFGAKRTDPTDTALACGSPGEVANDPKLGNHYWFPLSHTYNAGSGTVQYELDFPMDTNEAKSAVWANVVFKSDDQLRLRVAWALSQVCVASNSGLSRSTDAEAWTVWHDLFVRNAFGNYRDVLREVSYSPIMGEFLTHLNNKAFIYEGRFPDENYAREIMQLFSVGLFKLNTDGTVQQDAQGNGIDTYDNEDIQPNLYDPMRLIPKWRDCLPKAKLDAGYIGDKYPVCQEASAAHFLQAGERYRLVGTISVEGKTFDTATYRARDGQEFEQIMPQPGWVEHDPAAIWASTRAVIAGACAKAKIVPADFAAVGITNQRETTVVWDRRTGKPLYNALVWMTTHTEQLCARLEAEGGKDRFRAKTGLPVATYFSASKIRWILDNVEGARELAEAGDALFGNTDAWLTWNLTGGPDGGVHVTDVTNASRTQLMDLATLDWDDELLRTFDIPRAMLPMIRSSSERYGDVAPARAGGGAAAAPGTGCDELAGVSVAGVLGDQQAALFGQTCFG
eukprot:g7544.t1